MSNVNINIAAEFTGKPAFKKASKATDSLTKDVKKLAGSLGVAFGAQQFISYGRRAVKAFADSELEATRLTTAVSNLGLAFAAPEIDRYIDNVELATGVNRDLLQPSLITLLQTTGSLTKSQELLNLSLDIAAGTGQDVASVSQRLSQAYLGQSRGLRSLNLGLTAAELNTADFETIQRRLTELFAGQGEAAAESYVGQINKLTIASEQASEIIGQGLVESLLILSNNTTVGDLADDMLVAARNTAAFTQAIAGLANAINAPVKGLANIFAEFIRVTDPFVDLLVTGDPSGFMKKPAASSASAPRAGFNGRTFYADAQKNAESLAKAENEARRRAAQLLAIKKKQQQLEAKALKDKRLANAIDKANVALGKGSEVFDIEKIQVAAALTNQAEQLGKATSSAQLLQIANDTARLNVKRSILNLEDAIAAKDEAAIIAATKKLNADLGVLNALTGQNTQMKAIESILAGLKPKELIDQKNLDEALRKIRQMLDELAKVKTPTLGGGGGSTGGGGGSGGGSVAPATFASVAAKEAYDAVTYFAQKATDAFQTVEDSGAFNALVNMYAGGAINPFNAGSFRMAEGGTVFNSGAVGSRDRDIIINVNTGIGDPNAIAEAIDNVLREARDRGTLTIA